MSARWTIPLLLLGVLAAGCGTTQLVAPPGREVYMLDADAPAAIRSQRTVWFWMWGARPISDNTTQQEIIAHNLREVRFTTYQTWFEMLTNPLTSIVSIQRRQMVVEGNP